MSPDQDLAVVAVGAEQVERAAMDKQGRPERAMNFGGPLPRNAAITGSEHNRRRFLFLSALRAKKIMRRNVIAVRQNREAR